MDDIIAASEPSWREWVSETPMAMVEKHESPYVGILRMNKIGKTGKVH